METIYAVKTQFPYDFCARCSLPIKEGLKFLHKAKFYHLDCMVEKIKEVLGIKS